MIIDLTKITETLDKEGIPCYIGDSESDYDTNKSWPEFKFSHSSLLTCIDGIIDSLHRLLVEKRPYPEPIRINYTNYNYQSSFDYSISNVYSSSSNRDMYYLIDIVNLLKKDGYRLYYIETKTKVDANGHSWDKHEHTLKIVNENAICDSCQGEKTFKDVYGLIRYKEGIYDNIRQGEDVETKANRRKWGLDNFEVIEGWELK